MSIKLRPSKSRGFFIISYGLFWKCLLQFVLFEGKMKFLLNIMHKGLSLLFVREDCCISGPYHHNFDETGSLWTIWIWKNGFKDKFEGWISLQAEIDGHEMAAIISEMDQRLQSEFNCIEKTVSQVLKNSFDEIHSVAIVSASANPKEQNLKPQKIKLKSRNFCKLPIHYVFLQFFKKRKNPVKAKA